MNQVKKPVYYLTLTLTERLLSLCRKKYQDTYCILILSLNISGYDFWPISPSPTVYPFTRLDLGTPNGKGSE